MTSIAWNCDSKLSTLRRYSAAGLCSSTLRQPVEDREGRRVVSDGDDEGVRELQDRVLEL